MNKGILTLYVDNELKLAGKAKLINLSSMFNEALRVEIEGVNEKGSEKEMIQSLKSKLIKANTELAEERIKCKKLEAKNERGKTDNRRIIHI